VVTLPAGEDPDSFVRTRGAAELEAQLESAIDVFERKIQILERAGWFGELQKKRRALDRLLPTIRATSDPIMRDLYVSRAAEVAGVDRKLLLGEAASMSGEPMSRALPEARIRTRAEPPSRQDHRPRIQKVEAESSERELIRAMLTQRVSVETIAERIGVTGFREPHYRALFAALLKAGQPVSLFELTEDLTPEDVLVAEWLLEEPETQRDPQKTVTDSLARIEAREIEKKIDAINGLLPLASDEQRSILEKELAILIKDGRSSGKMGYKAFRRGRAH
jgi:DNA primase